MFPFLIFSYFVKIPFGETRREYEGYTDLKIL